MITKTEIKEILTDLGYIVDSHFNNRDSIRFNLPAIGEHIGYAIRLMQNESGFMHIFDGGEPTTNYSYNDDTIRFTRDHLLIDHAENYDIGKIRKILVNKTKTIIRQGKKLKKQIRFRKIEKL